MRFALAALLIAHGVAHLVGFAVLTGLAFVLLGGAVLAGWNVRMWMFAQRAQIGFRSVTIGLACRPRWMPSSPPR